MRIIKTDNTRVDLADLPTRLGRISTALKDDEAIPLKQLADTVEILKEYISLFVSTNVSSYQITNVSVPIVIPIESIIHTVECLSGSISITLPSASINTRKILNIKSIVGEVTILSTDSQTIDGVISGTIEAGDNIQLLSNGSNWIII